MVRSDLAQLERNGCTTLERIYWLCTTEGFSPRLGDIFTNYEIDIGTFCTTYFFSTDSLCRPQLF